MAKADGSIIIDITADSNKAVKGVNKVKSSVDGLASAAKKLAGVLAATFAIDRIVAFGKEAIELGSNVAEVQNVVDVAFGEMSYKAEAFAETAIETFGMSQLAAKQTASTYMAMAKNMGLSMDDASDMAITLAGLTGDVASFYNTSQELADIKLKSVFTGETETLKDLGIVMTQANLSAYALERGLTKDISAMSQAELVTLRYNFVLDQLASVSGDFTRTQDSWANQTRILSMQWQEFMSIIGQALTRILLPLVRILNQVVAYLIDAANAFSAILSAFFGGSNALQQTQSTVSGISSGISEAVSNQNALTEATEETNKAQQQSLASFDEINRLPTPSNSGGGPSGSGAKELTQLPAVSAAVAASAEVPTNIANFINALKNAFADFVSFMRTTFPNVISGASSLFDAFKGVWTDLQSLGSPILNWVSGDFLMLLSQFAMTVNNVLGGLLDSIAMVLSGLWDAVVFPALQLFVTDVLPVVTQFVTQVLMTFDVLFNEVKGIFDMIWQDAIAPALEVISNIWTGLWEGVSNTWDKYGAPIFDQIRTVISNMADILRRNWDNMIKPIWDTFMDTLDDLWTYHFKPLWDNILEFVAILVKAALEIYNGFIAPLAKWFTVTFGPAIAETVSAIIERVGIMLGVFVDIASGIIEALGGIIEFIMGVFTQDWERAWNGIKTFFSGIWDGMIGILEGAINLIISGINWLISQLNKVSFDVPDWVPLIGGSKFGFNIPAISEVSIPRLAQGAVIPPNREFLAVLGDQTRGYNYEVPDDKLRQLIREETGAGNTAVLREILAAIKEGKVIAVDGQQFGKLVYRYNSKESKRVGTRLVEG